MVFFHKINARYQTLMTVVVAGRLGNKCVILNSAGALWCKLIQVE